MASRSPSRDRHRTRTRSPTPRSDYSRRDRRRNDSRSVSRSLSRSRSRSLTRSPSRSRSRSRSRSVTPRRNGRYRSDSRSLSRSRSRTPDRRGGSTRGRSLTPVRSTKVVVEKLTKNVNEDHLYEIFGQFGRIKDLDLPINRLGTNRGTAFILYDDVADAEDAISHMHEAQIDGAVINVSIVLPRRKMSPPPPAARRGMGAPFQPSRGGRGRFGGVGHRGGHGGPPTGPAADRLGGGSRLNSYRPRSGHRSPSRSASPRPASKARGSDRDRYRSRTRSRTRSPSRSRTPPRRGGGGSGRRESRDYGHSRRKRSTSRGSYDMHDDRRSRGRSRR